MLRPSIITSFNTSGIVSPQPDAYRQIDNELIHAGRGDLAPLPVELYVAMEPDLRHFDRKVKPLRNRTAPFFTVDCFSNLTITDIQCIAKEVTAAVSTNCGARDRQIIALATYIPEIVRQSAITHADRDAERALGNILTLGQILRDTYGHPVKVAEIVCGTRFFEAQGGPPSQGIGRIDLDVTLDSVENSQDRLISRLEGAVNWARKQNSGQLPAIALELEPGPFFVLRDLQSITEIAKKLSANSTLSSTVGFNLDMAHWRIAKVGPEMIKQLPDILSRIVHAHISGHHARAHLGDCAPTEEDWTAFQPWIDILCELTSDRTMSLRMEQDLPAFSGHVSIELEACNELRQVVTTVYELARRLPS